MSNEIKMIITKSSGKEDVTQYLSSVTWEGSDKQAARTLSFSIVYDMYSPGSKTPDIQLGDTAELYYKDDWIFVGEVTARERRTEPGALQYTATDGMMHLLRSSGTYRFENTTPEKITQMVAADAGIGIGTIPATGLNIDKMFFQQRPFYEIIMAAYTKVKAHSGKLYMAKMDGVKLSVIEKGVALPNYWLKQGERILTSSYSENTDSMVNRVAVYDSNNNKVGEFSNGDWVNKYGIFQNAISVDSGNGQAEAEAEMQGVSQTATLECLGDVGCVAGVGVRVQDTLSGLTGIFWIEHDSHTWENGTHTMSLDLAFQNVMDEYQEDEEQTQEDESVITGEDEGGTLNGKRVPALYTAYFPYNDAMEGGYYDAQGNKLDPSKKTCAAPKEIPFGTQIQIQGTGTNKDGETYTVTDRGGAINIVNGTYHFDLLMSTRTQCNNWGRVNGYAIIGDGTGYTNANNSGGTSQAQKVINYAKKYIGKLTYSMNGNLRMNLDGGYADCSGFVYVVFKKSVGITLGTYTGAQVDNGVRVEKGDLRMGDLVMFKNTYDSGYKYGVSHVGIYIANNEFIHMGSSGCSIQNLGSSYYASHYLMGRRVL